MKEKLINNLGLKILSCFLAFFMWLIVVNVSNPEVTGSKEVPLEIVNEQVLTKAGRTYELGGKDTVTVYFGGSHQRCLQDPFLRFPCLCRSG